MIDDHFVQLKNHKKLILRYCYGGITQERLERMENIGTLKINRNLILAPSRIDARRIYLNNKRIK